MPLNEPDQITNSKTIYVVGMGEIFWRNFVAGISRALGGLVIYFAVVILLANLFTQFLWPIIGPSFQSFDEAMEILKQNQNFPNNVRR